MRRAAYNGEGFKRRVAYRSRSIAYITGLKQVSTQRNLPLRYFNVSSMN